MENPQRVVVVEDDPHLAEVVSRYLLREGYSVDTFGNGADALSAILDAPPALVVLDVMLPGLDGFEVLRRLRTVSAVPVVLLTARDQENDRIHGLDLGADDYLAKPFSPRELMSRVRAVLRRARPAGTDSAAVLRAGELELDLVSHQARRRGDLLALTAKEFDLLAFMMSRPGVALPRTEILANVWGWTIGDDATVTVHVRRLREKTEQDPSEPRHLCTVRGVGYRWEP
jgi:DNA-binding response OmpR family regulator